MKFYYFDTSIWLDYYEKRGKNGEHAFNLILKIIEEDSAIIYSDLHIRELKGLGYSIEQINDVFRIVKPDNIRRVHISRELEDKARELATQRKIPVRDAIHALTARYNQAIMVATDKHFHEVRHVIEAKNPEELY